ncbi:MAG: glycosyltransferase family 39 protein [Bacteroidota bacterium]
MAFHLNTKFIKPNTYRIFTFDNFLIAATIAITLFTRIFHLTNESLWLDELFSMCISNPDQSFSEISSGIQTDFHPPFYYYFLNSVFRVFPYNDFVGRLISAITGILGVFLMFVLGKTMKNNQTGILMAFLTSLCFFQIKYSQEIRMYILIFSLTVLLTIIFIKIIRNPKSYYFVLYTIVAAVSIYTHYFAFFILLGFSLCFFHLMISGIINKSLIVRFIVSNLGIIILYLPWIPSMIATGGRHHLMKQPDAWYFLEYLYSYTGKEPLTTLFIFSGLFLFIIQSIRLIRKGDIKSCNKQYLNIMVIFYSILSVYCFTYIISFFKPILNRPSTIVAIPFVIAAVISGFYEIKRTYLFLMLSVLVISNSINIVFINKYYTTNSKDNYKQISATIYASNKHRKDTIAICQVADFYDYYIRQTDSEIKLFNPNEYKPSEVLDGVNGFYVINAPSTNEKQRKLEEITEFIFLILNPRIKQEVVNIGKIRNLWNDYIRDNFILDTIITDKINNKEVAFRFIKKHR